MHEYIFLNGEVTTSSEAGIPAISAAALYGKGIFTTIAIYAGKPFLWEKHWRRLQDNAAKLNIDLSEFSEVKTKDALKQIIAKNGVTRGRARITFFDESASKVWPFENERKTSLLITTADFRQASDNFRLTISPYKINSSSPLLGIKSCNYLENFMALEAAQAQEFSEAICLNGRGEITSACIANIFWLKNEKLYTPSLKTGCLSGTTREFIMENLECEEVEIDIDTLRSANAIFLTSAGLGVAEVDDLEGQKLKKSDHPITNLISATRNAG